MDDADFELTKTGKNLPVAKSQGSLERGANQSSSNTLVDFQLTKTAKGIPKPPSQLSIKKEDEILGVLKMLQETTDSLERE